MHISMRVVSIGKARCGDSMYNGNGHAILTTLDIVCLKIFHFIFGWSVHKDNEPITPE